MRRPAAALRLIVVLCLVLLPAACRNGPAGGGAVAGGPAGDPPKLDIAGPPAAWLSVGDQKVWLAYSSYCWVKACADYIDPVERDDIPLVRAEIGSKAVFHLGFDPESVDLVIAAGAEPLQIQANGREPTWTVDRTALLVLNAQRAGGGQASYAVDVRFPQPGAGS
jgi:hypothetical protein